MKFNAKAILILIVMTCLTACLCGCGGGGSDEETVEITTVAEEEAEAAQQDENMSEYEKIYNEYNDKMKSATEQYVAETKEQAKKLSKDDLYDFIAKKTDALEKIRQEGADKMTEKTLDSTDDDQSEYEKWFSKLTESYTEYTRQITAIYTDQF